MSTENKICLFNEYQLRCINKRNHQKYKRLFNKYLDCFNCESWSFEYEDDTYIIKDILYDQHEKTKGYLYWHFTCLMGIQRDYFNDIKEAIGFRDYENEVNYESCKMITNKFFSNQIKENNKKKKMLMDILNLVFCYDICKDVIVFVIL